MQERHSSKLYYTHKIFFDDRWRLARWTKYVGRSSDGGRIGFVTQVTIYCHAKLKGSKSAYFSIEQIIPCGFAVQYLYC